MLYTTLPAGQRLRTAHSVLGPLPDLPNFVPKSMPPSPLEPIGSVSQYALAHGVSAVLTLVAQLEIVITLAPDQRIAARLTLQHRPEASENQSVTLSAGSTKSHRRQRTNNNSSKKQLSTRYLISDQKQKRLPEGSR